MEFQLPGIYFKEFDYSEYASKNSFTKLALIGLTDKGKAFMPIKIKNTNELRTFIGDTNPAYPLTYVAWSYLEQGNDLTIIRILGNNGYTNTPAHAIYVDDQSSRNILCILREKRGVSISDVTIQADDTSGLIHDINYKITIILESNDELEYVISFNPNANNYIVNVFGDEPTSTTNDYLYVEEIFPGFIQLMQANINSVTVGVGSIQDDTEYNEAYSNAKSPWIVSGLIDAVNDIALPLFRVHVISDGDSSNYIVKISIANIDTQNKTFDLLVRRYNDVDNVGFTEGILERYSKLTMNPNSPKFIGRMIGTIDGLYKQNSKYISIELAPNFLENAVPMGHEGYEVKRYNINSNNYITPIYYKTSYTQEDNVSRTFLGLTEKLWGSKVSVPLTHLFEDILKYHGKNNVYKTLGFHLENNNNINFVHATGLNSSNKVQLKFNVFCQGGFDGFDKYITFDDYASRFKYASSPSTPEEVESNHCVEQCLKAIDLLKKKDELPVNLVALPGINFKDNTKVVHYTLEVVENLETCFYIIDAPRNVTEINNIKTYNVGELINDLENADIDSSYAATYWPWLIIQDPITQKLSAQPPTLLAVQTLTYVDNVYTPWSAPAGIDKTPTNKFIKYLDVNLLEEEKGLLYENRINNIIFIPQQGFVVWGQKTLLKSMSSLDRIKVRRLLLYLKQSINEVIKNLVFEENDEVLRDQFMSKVEPILMFVKSQRGLYEYKIIMDDMDNYEALERNIFNVTIKIKPTKTAEFINITFEIMPLSANL